MGTIYSMWKPKYWKIILKGESKICEGDTVYKMIIGEFDDYYICGNVSVFISKDIYEKIINNEFSVIVNGYEDYEDVIKVFNREGFRVPIINGMDVPEESLEKSKVLVRK